MGDRLGLDRRRTLLRGSTYKQIAQGVVEEAIVLDHKLQRACSDPELFRAQVTLRVDPSIASSHHVPRGLCPFRDCLDAFVGDIQQHFQFGS